ncbi:hypothetical protein SDC9_132017 [bioreactor metagenome]|jgi:hypothetical protein|uniref:Uncharacterized protein n=2 Tax=root TaxID=1 RepID=A0AAN0K7T6_9ACTN|nr:hypothetical protein [Brooklawnia sp. SH051]MCB0883328.1 hypothetical protein [Propionibacteriaceae bacterium]NLI85753.1 hypothetical protein [Propionibacterium sp.]BEH03295.1 hypothetical protein brsh051_25760 [Brooklawnia sp. SH051]
MADSVYRALSRVFSVVLPVVGAGAMIGGSFAHRFVSDQLGSEDITMPAPELITQELKTGLISPDDAELLSLHAGETLSNGPQARIYADNYVLAHMKVAAERAGVPEDQATYAGVGDLAAELNKQLKAELKEQYPEMGPGEIAGLARMEIKDPETEYDLARKINQFYELRSENFFMGNAIRGMLLNAYGWWLVGLVARIAGALLIGFGGFLGLLGFGRRRAR